MRVYFFCLLLFVLSSFYALSIDNASIIDFQTNKFKDMLVITSTNYADSVDIKKASEAAFRAFLSSLDQQSVYFDSLSYAQAKTGRTGATVGIGAVLLSVLDTAVVFSIEPNSPADSAGLKRGDKIIYINGQKTIGKNESELAELIQGEKNAKCELLIKRGKNSQLIELVAVFSDYHINSLRAGFKIPLNDFGYLKLTKFSVGAYSEFYYAVSKLRNNNVNNIIIDFRGNPGGELTEIQKIAALFLKEGDTIINTQALSPNYKTVAVVESDGEFADMGVVVFQDNQSASGSEIIAGIIQDYDIGIVIGDISFGKGTAQNWWEFSDGSAFRITVAKYLTPAGRQIQRDDKKGKASLDEEAKFKIGEKGASQIEEMLAKFGGTNVNTVNSKGGNTLITSSGGIFPNSFASSDTITKLTEVIQTNRTMYEFVYDYILEKNGLIQKYENYKDFAEKHLLDSADMMKFKDMSFRRNIWNQDMFDKDYNYLKNLFKARIAEATWGEEAFHYCNLLNDNYYKKALISLDELNRIRKLRK